MNGGPHVLFGEPLTHQTPEASAPVVWDSFPVYLSRQGLRVTVGREEPVPKKPPGYPNPIREADRVRKAAREMPGATHSAIGKVLGLSGNYVGDLLRMSRLPDEIQNYVRQLGPFVRRSQIMGIDLRRISLIKGVSRQVARFKKLLKERDLPPLGRTSKIERQ